MGHTFLFERLFVQAANPTGRSPPENTLGSSLTAPSSPFNTQPHFAWAAEEASTCINCMKANLERASLPTWVCALVWACSVLLTLSWSSWSSLPWRRPAPFLPHLRITTTSASSAWSPCCQASSSLCPQLYCL